MIKKFLQKTFNPTIVRLTKKYSSNPDKNRIFFSLTALLEKIRKNPGKRGTILNIDQNSKIILFSDQHRGAKNYADDFWLAEPNYLAALQHYLDQDYTFISLGDSEEFWENTVLQVKKHNRASFDIERKFHALGRFYKIFGNHDLHWDNDPLASFHLADLYGTAVKIYEGILLSYQDRGTQIELMLTHGHQGDKQSDGNWLSKWFISTVWAPLQAYLQVNPNTPSEIKEYKTFHNQLMYDWVSQQKDLMLITGHTHQPVFKSLTLLEKLYLQLETARAQGDVEAQKAIEEKLKDQLNKGETIPTYKAYKSTYFNTGCCCYSDGDITGIEIANGKIALVKWKHNAARNASEKMVLEEAELEQCLDKNK